MPLSNGSCIVANTGGTFGRIRELSHKLFGLAPLLNRQVKAFEPHLMHAHFGPDGLRALSLATRLRIPLLVTFHGADATMNDEHAHGSYYSYRRFVRRRCYLAREARGFLAVSEFIRDRLIARGFPVEKIRVHYTGVDTQVFTPDPRVERDVTVLFVGRLVENKGAQHLIRAVAGLQATIEGIQLVIIGDGPQRRELQRLVDDTRCRAKFLGYRPPDQVRAWMQRSCVFSVPSVTIRSGESEGFGMVFAEAQSCGLPVISFATGGIVEAVKHGETGFLASEGDEAALARHLQRVIEDGPLRQRLGAAARERVCRRFDLRLQTRRLEEIYDEVSRVGSGVLARGDSKNLNIV